MSEFGKKSKERLSTCHPVLQELMARVIARRDISIVCGHRGEAEQNSAFDAGNSKLRWPQSYHNTLPSMAVDVVPWPEQWGSEDAFLEVAIIVREEWAKMDHQGFNLRWGGDWDGDGDRSDQTFDDMPHWEIR